MARKGNMYEKEVKSNYLNETIALRIYEPEEIDSLYETNVCIMHDGNDYYNIGRVATVSDQLHENFDIVNTVFVGIHYNDRFERRERYHPRGKEHDLYMKFFIEEAMPVIKDLIPLNPLGVNYSLMGDSLAGTFSFITALRHPGVFSNVIMQSPLVNEDMIKLAEESDDLNRLTIYHTIGLLETDVKTTVDGKVEFVKPNQKLKDILSEKVTNYYYYEFEDGIHTWKYWQEDLPRALSTIFN